MKVNSDRAISFKGFYNNKVLKKGLEFASDNGALFAATTTLILYAGYYIPMQVLGFFRWNKHLKADKKEIVKTRLNLSDLIKLALITLSAAIISIIILILSGDKSPYIDGITTVFSVAGMYLTVKRCIEQWLVWLIVNGLSFVMWLKIALEGEKVYSTVLMWGVYFILAIYFYIKWKQDIFPSKYTP